MVKIVQMLEITSDRNDKWQGAILLLSEDGSISFAEPGETNTPNVEGPTPALSVTPVTVL